MSGVPEPVVDAMIQRAANTRPLRILARAMPGLGPELRPFDGIASAGLVAALLLDLDCRPCVPRIEALLHFIVGACQGTKVPSRTEIARWFNRHVDRTTLSRMEDPAEDLFTMQVSTLEGNFRFLGGISESPAYFVQHLLDVIESLPDRPEFQALHREVHALLKLSNATVERAELDPWELGANGYATQVPLMDYDSMEELRAHLTFTPHDFAVLGIDAADLASFVLVEADRAKLLEDELGRSALERRPLLVSAGTFLLALPTAVSVAVRQHIARTLVQAGLGDSLRHQLLHRQLHALSIECLKPLDAPLVTIPNIPPRPPNLSAAEYVTCFDTGAYGIVVVVLDDPLAFLQEGLFQYRDFSREWPPVEQRLNEVVALVSQLPDFRCGLVVYVFGGLGGSLSIPLPILPENWFQQSYSLPNLEVLARQSHPSMRRLWRLARAEQRLRKHGISLANMNGDFNLYAWWKHNDDRLLPREVPWQQQLMFQVPLNALAELRREDVAAYSPHVVYHKPTKNFVRVRRYAPFPYFRAEQYQPFYVAYELASQRRLWGVIEDPARAWWIVCEQDANDPATLNAIFQLWHCACEWAIRLGPMLRPLLGSSTRDVEIHLRLTGMECWGKTADLPREVTHAPAPALEIDELSSTATITIDGAVYAAFRSPVNIAERQLVAILARAAFGLTGRPFPAEKWPDLESQLFPNDDVRYLHTTIVTDIEFAGMSQVASDPELLPHEALTEARAGAAPSSSQLRIVHDREQAKQIVFTAVERLKQENLTALGHIERKSCVERFLDALADVRRDRHTWQVSAAALRALTKDQSELERTALRRQNRRDAQATASRALIEAALFACPDAGGHEISMLEFEDLLARQIVLIELANFAEALKSPLEVDPVRVLPSGEIEVGGVLQDRIIREFGGSLFRQRFRWAADHYADHFRESAGRSSEPGVEALRAAFTAEYRLNFSDIADFVGVLARDADRAGRPHLLIRRSDLVQSMARELNVAPDLIAAFVERASLYPRTAWNAELPSGYKDRDVQPWHFRRRMSLTARPIIQLDQLADPILVLSPALMEQSFNYLARETMAGSFNPEFFDSEPMRAFVRERSAAEASKFESSVAEAFQDAGYRVIRNVQMRSLGVPANENDLGEVDVIAWRETGSIYVVECKLLRWVYSTADVVHQLKEFAGAPKDSLGKHLERVKWLNANRRGLESIVSRTVTGSLESILVTSNLVPLQFLTNEWCRGAKVIEFAALSKVMGRKG